MNNIKYCFECGKQLPNNSKFCPFCGNKQNNGEKDEINNELPKINTSNDVKLDSTILKKILSYYIVWVLIHLGLLLIGSSGIFDGNNMGVKRFWPFGSSVKYFNDNYYDRELGRYDITEFLVYTLFPLAFFIIWRLLKNDTKFFFKK